MSCYTLKLGIFFTKVMNTSIYIRCTGLTLNCEIVEPCVQCCGDFQISTEQPDVLGHFPDPTKVPIVEFIQQKNVNYVKVEDTFWSKKKALIPSYSMLENIDNHVLKVSNITSFYVHCNFISIFFKYKYIYILYMYNNEIKYIKS